MSGSRINLDYTSATPILPEVRRAIDVALSETGNPSSIHQGGRWARRLVDLAREQTACLINSSPGELYFTSCGSESNNWAIRGLIAANKRKGNHLIISNIEHPSISAIARRVEMENIDLTILPVNQEGLVSTKSLKDALTPETALVSIMLANGEVGTVEPIQEFAAIAHAQGALFHTDAIAAVGHHMVDVKALGVDALSFSANQFYAPAGAAALYVREGVRILPLIEGGGQETGGRSGTEALLSIVGMGAAAEIAKREMSQRIMRLSRLRNRLGEGLKERIDSIHFYGSHAARLSHNLHVSIDGLSGESLVLGFDQAGISVGLGSACNSKAIRPSHVLKAMSLTDEQAKGAIVFTIGVMTTEDEIERALEIIPNVVKKLRNVTSLTARISS